MHLQQKLVTFSALIVTIFILSGKSWSGVSTRLPEQTLVIGDTVTAFHAINPGHTEY